MRRLTVLLVLASTAFAAQAAAPVAALPPIRHVLLIVLENEPYEASFGARSPAPYLARVLPRQGVLLPNYYGIGHSSLPNYVALISGQAPNEATQLDCPVFSDFRLSAAGLDASGQALGSGCVYPPTVRTLSDQLEGAGLTWKGYMEDMGNDPRREASTCAHVPLGRPEATRSAELGDEYAAKHDPFVYFHSIIDDPARCAAHVVSLAHLREDLQSIATTPNYGFIVPNLCNDGHDTPCVDGRPGGLAAINAFLAEWVPRIVRAPAFRANGLLIITFDEAAGGGRDGSGSCCGERGLPGARYAPGISGPGGGRIGALVLSPFARPGTASTVPYNHYSLLKTVEAIFALPPLGYAAQPGLRVFGSDVFTVPASAPAAH
ncbi:MAG: alkaline phosphatase family protein [Steroidobacteraceae bacterium]